MITGKRVPPHLKAILDRGEEMLWIGRPVLMPFLLQDIRVIIAGLTNPVIILLLFGGPALLTHRVSPSPWPIFLFAFLATVMAAAQIVYFALIYRNTFYAITDRRIIISGGVYAPEFRAIDYDGVAETNVTVRMIESWYHAGSIRGIARDDIPDDTSLFQRRHRTPLFPRMDTRFIAVNDPYRVYELIKQTANDVRSDWRHPNALRPQENPGYGRSITGA